ncbi:VIT domain-containing protein [Enhygromyxa salina]|uniref:Vault protein inter-alpha-trypsin n=1 Tax=Enhygromyxa salina TaxID=215803 RepID=A0A2S9YYA2_9BACT|nr:VIT domain-containing protein [Enhygromyxa salina]PRQ10057.1 Vault protein inter-alpha-trypsin [Enhygromyxa salina]
MSDDQVRSTQDDTEIDLDAIEAHAAKLAQAPKQDPKPAPAAPPPDAKEEDTRPSKLLGVIGFVAVALLSIGAVFAYQGYTKRAQLEPAASIGAKLELAAGEVVLLAADGAESEDRLLSGTPLPLGAKLRTGTGARALIRLADGSRIFLNEATAIELGKDTGVSVLTGELWLETPPLDQKREPLVHQVGSATLALTDGGASLTISDEGAIIYIAEGVATVTSPGGPKEVRSGEQAVIKGNDAPLVTSVPYWDDWTGGMADRRAGGAIGGGSGSLYAVDRYAAPGTPSLPLQISSQSVDIAIDQGLAETRVDQRFFNPSDRDVEGWYWFTIPNGATLVGFALETNGELVDGEIVEKKQAAATYERAVASNDNPALLEWIDERTVRARVYPVPAMGERRVVVRYQQLLSENRGKLRYSYPLAGGGRDATTIEEFALAVELRGELANQYTISTLDEATVSNDDGLITMRRSGFTPRADFELELTRKPDQEPAPALRLSQYEAGRDQARFVMLRWLPDLDFAKVNPRADVVVVVDTSAFGDDSEHQSRVAVAEALLRSLSSEDHFALMAADLTAEVLFPADGLSPATPEAISEALEVLTSHRPGGATDLGAIFERALSRVHEAEQPAIVYVGDGLATSGERGADELTERLRRALAGSRARLFTVGVGPAVEDRLLARLARVGGGESLRVETSDQAVVRALELSGALKTPTITDLELELGAGLDDRFDNATGKLARGQELVVLARTHNELPESVTIRGRLGGESFERDYPLVHRKDALEFVVPKLWAAARIERLLGDGRGPEAVRGKVLSLGLEYGLMTPFTSFLALESERAYARQGVERRDRPWDFQLLGAVLPNQWEIEPNRPDLSDSPDPGELLLGALMAPMGCDKAEPGARDDRAAVAAAPMPKSEEGRMGNASPRPEADSKEEYAEPEPEMAAEMPQEESEAMYDEAPAAPPASAPVATGMPSEGGKGGPGARGGGGAMGPADLPSPPAEPMPERQASSDGYAKAKKSASSFEDDLVGGDDGSELDAPDSELAGLVEHERLNGQLGEDVAQGLSATQKSRPKSATKNRQRPQRSQVVSPVARNEKLPCSDASARSLAQRKVLWEQRLERTPDMIARLRAYENAAASCELENWKQQRVFLQLLQTRASTEAEIELLLAHFNGEQESQAFVARALLRRLVEPGLIGAVERSMYGGSLDWRAVADEAERATSAEAALEVVTLALTKHADASEDERLPLDLIRIDLLFELDRINDAITAARKLRERGLITPLLAQRLGELLVEAGQDEEAKRVFSEIVEYDPSGEYTRRLLGDIFLRHGWYQEAYRQYQDLVSLSAAPTDVIRMARAAAGAGRVDEGLRLLRKVIGGEGRPGVDDPRRFARLHAAVLIGELLATDDQLPRAKLERELDRLQLFDTPTTWTLISWRDLEHDLTLGVEPLAADADRAAIEAAKKAALQTSDGRLAGDTGLWAIQTGGLGDLVVRHRGEVPARAVSFERLTITWDGEHFEVERELGTIAARAARQGDESDAEDEDDVDDSI